MKILIVAPWFRTLAQLYGRHLADSGHSVLIVTSDRQFEDGYGYCDELVVDNQRSFPKTEYAAWKIAKLVRDFGPDIVLEEPFSHPKWLMLTIGMRRILMLHEPVPSRDTAQIDWKRRQVQQVQKIGIAGVVCFSQHSAALARSSGWNRVKAIPLISEMPDEWVPEPVSVRRGFVVVGRRSYNKGIDIAADAWLALDEQTRAREPLSLILSEGSDYTGETCQGWSQNGINVRLGNFNFSGIVNCIAKHRIMLLPYRSASQSGAQALAMQLGLLPLVSNVGALPECQPPFTPALSNLDAADWALRMAAEVQHSFEPSASLRIRAHYNNRLGGTCLVRSALQDLIQNDVGP